MTSVVRAIPRALTEVSAAQRRHLHLLGQLRDEHPIWNNSLFRACRDGSVTRADLRAVWSQYWPFARDFTRYVAGVISCLPCDLDRARLTDNLFDETGRGQVSRRHSLIFSQMMATAFGASANDADVAALSGSAPARRLVDDFERGTLGRLDPLSASAFVALGCEAIVPRYYGMLLDAHRRLGMTDEQLEFLIMHCECDAHHAAQLETIVASLQHQLDMPFDVWASETRNQMLRCLDAKHRFFSSAFELVQPLARGPYATTFVRQTTTAATIPA